MNFTFAEALIALKMGFQVTRKGWQDGEFIVLQKGYPDGIPCNKQTAEAWGLNEGDLFKCNPYFQKRNADGSHSMYSLSNDDILSEDWCKYVLKIDSITFTNKKDEVLFRYPFIPKTPGKPYQIDAGGHIKLEGEMYHETKDTSTFNPKRREVNETK